MAVIRPANNIRLPAIAVSSAEEQTGLTFLENGTAGSDIRLVWTGANLLPRVPHTFIWKSFYIQQTGYYATTWHSHNDGSFHGDGYDYGCHPYPTDGSYDSGTGQSTGGTGSSGTVHYDEIAGLVSVDYISSPGGANGGPKLVVKGIWRTFARVCFVSGANHVHRHYRDIENDLGDYIEIVRPTSSMTSPSDPAFYFGTSDWRTGIPFAGANDECPYGHHRGFAAFDAALTASEIQTEAASDSNSPQTAAGIASVWYINKNPTPDDVTDKSGEGHDPEWANANRPTLWEP